MYLTSTKLVTGYKLHKFGFASKFLTSIYVPITCMDKHQACTIVAWLVKVEPEILRLIKKKLHINPNCFYQISFCSLENHFLGNIPIFTVTQQCFHTTAHRTVRNNTILVSQSPLFPNEYSMLPHLKVKSFQLNQCLEMKRNEKYIK